MKIAHLTSVHPWNDIRIFMKMCRSLAKAGHEVHLYTADPKAPAGQVVEGVHVHSFALPSGRIKRMLASTRVVTKIFEGVAVDLVHVHDPELLFAVGVLRRNGFNVIFDMHENTPKALRSKVWIPRVARRPVAWLYQALERRVLNRIPVVFAEESYVADYPWVTLSRVVQNFPDPDLFHDSGGLEKPGTSGKRSCDPDSPLRICYIGAITKFRGSLMTLKAMALLKQRGVSVQFECIGPSQANHMQDLLTTVKELGLESEVTFRGRMAANEAWQIASSCHAGLAVLEPIENYFGSYPTKMFEYLLMGLPAIVSNFPLYKTIIDSARCGLLVDPTDCSDLAEAIEWVGLHPDEARQMGERGAHLVLEKYNWHKEFENLLGLYRAIV